MIYDGVDTVARFNEKRARIAKENGISFVCRYLVPDKYGKALLLDEATALRNAGLAILLCWEIGAEDMKGGANKGAQHGVKARALAESMKIPSNTTIYFAADYNVPPSDLIRCEEYIKAAQATLGGYNAGVYGPERLMNFFLSRGSCKYFWQCVAWSNTFLNVHVKQYAWQGDPRSKEVAAKIGFDVDLDSCEDMRAAGMWMPPTVAEPWYADTMRWGQKEGVCDGSRPLDNATRAEVVQMIRNYNRRFEGEDESTLSGMLTDQL